MNVKILKIEISQKNRYKTITFKIGNNVFYKTFLRREKITPSLLMREIA
jgi:hypothetical protein